jgi:[acyl-carrier-protein] S-malonyltransferase
LVSKNVFEEVNDALGQDLSGLIWDGDIETLTLTENAQPALMATSIAAIKALEAEGIKFDQASYIAGHSLGEYSALCAAGSLSLTDTAKLLRIRGKAMQDAVPFGLGAMAAILGLDFETVSQITNSSSNDQICQAANDNDPGQVVISGHKNAVEQTIELAKDAGAKRAVLLPVSAPFHCSLMQPAADIMAKALIDIRLNDPIVPLVANVRANEQNNGDIIKDLLIEQVTGSVRWRESIEFMSSKGVSEVFEIGAGKALSGMVRRIDREISVNQVFDTSSVHAAVLKLK